MIDTTTGGQVGTTLPVSGSPWGVPVVSADGSSALVTTYVTDYSGATTTRVAAIDTATGDQVR